MGAIKAAFEAGRLFNEFEPEVNVEYERIAPKAAAKVYPRSLVSKVQPEAPEGYVYQCASLAHEMGWNPEGEFYVLYSLAELAESAKRREEAWF